MQYIKWWIMLMVTVVIIGVMQYHLPMVIVLYWMVIVSGAYLCTAGLHYVVSAPYTQEWDKDLPPMRAWTEMDHHRYHVKGRDWVIYHGDCPWCVSAMLPQQ